jgi:hypothetical protein
MSKYFQIMMRRSYEKLVMLVAVVMFSTAHGVVATVSQVKSMAYLEFVNKI